MTLRCLLAILLGADLVVLAMASIGGCAGSSGSTDGQPPPASDAGDGGGGGGGGGGDAPTWTALYKDYFGPSGQASCTAQSSCHGTAAQSGAQTSGYVCGTTKQSCWEGITMGIPPAQGGIFPAIAPPDAGNPAQTQLIASLHKATASGLNNMPCGDPPNCPVENSTYTFTANDIARISSWIQQGVPNN